MKNKNIKILLVDDEPDILEIVGYNLSTEGYKISTATNGIEAIAEAKKFKPHLILLDIMMPEMDGIEACEKLREIEDFKDTIIVFFTARGEDFSQSAGFDAGADDYITKPIKPKLLMKKVKALTRRIKEQEGLSGVKTLGSLVIDSGAYTVQINGETIALPKKEFELLTLLTSNPGNVFKRDEILNMVWSNVVVGDRTIDVHIRKLRKKIGDQYFKTIKGVGYKFVSDEAE
jgi:two-component system alkaline phosphatase synthesis response regulator PhoP